MHPPYNLALMHALHAACPCTLPAHYYILRFAYGVF